MTALEELSIRRQRRCLAFAKNSLKYPVGQALFPKNHSNEQNVRKREEFIVNFAHTESYRKSAVPYCQTLLNADHRTREAAARASVDSRARRREGG